MDIFAQIAERIIKSQENVIGPVAIEQARKVSGLQINWTKHEIIVNGDKKTVLENLLKQYEQLFGLASIEVCKDAVKGIISKLPKDQVPALLI